ncbi:MAG: hypothetical protein RLY15_213 [Bacteroidota bacterium]|jgi:acetyltransferase-like isoleucine patch superfamily enzyme
MKRDFSNESILNLIFRGLKSFNVRMRGTLYCILNIFHDKSCLGLCIGLNPKFINSKSIKLGKNVSLGNFTRIECFNGKNKSIQLNIGDESSFGDYLHIGVSSSIFIGKGVLGGSNILIIDHNHGTCDPMELRNLDVIPRKREIINKGEIIIEDNVWIGDDVKILGNVRIGIGSVIAAGSILTKDVLPFTVYIKK